MIIISSFRDYYDVVQKQGVDREVRFIREKQVISEQKSHGYYDHHRIIIVFCGKAYPLIQYQPDFTSGSALYFYSIEDIDRWMEANRSANDCDYYRGTRTKPRMFRYRYFAGGVFLNTSRKTLKARFEDESYQNTVPGLIKKADELRVPILVSSPKRLVANDHLGQYEFYRMVDCYSAYQSIYQYISSQAVPEKPIPYVPDDVMVGAKGFDVFSFRKDPEQ